MDVRRATADDAAGLAALRWEFRSTHRGEPNESREAFLARCTEWMRDRLSERSAWTAWVAEADEQTIGQVWVQLFEKMPNPTGERERHAYVSNLYVRSSARGGVGTALLDACLAWLAAQDVDSILLWPSPLSRSLYERHGFVSSNDVLVRKQP